MSQIKITCKKCGAQLEVDENVSSYSCKYCNTEYINRFDNETNLILENLIDLSKKAIANKEFEKAKKYIEGGLKLGPYNLKLLELESKVKEVRYQAMVDNEIEIIEKKKNILNIEEAEGYYLQAQYILIELQTNKKVYGTNSSVLVLQGTKPANIDLGLQYINRSLELFPDNPAYLNLRAVLLWEGKGNKEEALSLLEKANAINPRDINIKNNIENLKSTKCFIATAAYGSSTAFEVDILRIYRDNYLKKTTVGRLFIKCYYYISPSIARSIDKKEYLKRITVKIINPIVWWLKKKYVNNSTYLKYTDINK